MPTLMDIQASCCGLATHRMGPQTEGCIMDLTGSVIMFTRCWRCQCMRFVDRSRRDCRLLFTKCTRGTHCRVLYNYSVSNFETLLYRGMQSELQAAITAQKLCGFHCVPSCRVKVSVANDSSTKLENIAYRDRKSGLCAYVCVNCNRRHRTFCLLNVHGPSLPNILLCLLFLPLRIHC